MWSQGLWARIGVVASAVWALGMMLYATIDRNFYWTAYNGRPGPLAWAILLGMAVIFVVAIGVPWIAEQAKRDK